MSTRQMCKSKANWQQNTATKPVSLVKSSLFMKKLVAMSISHIIYLRGLMPERAFEDRDMSGVPVKIITEKSRFPPAMQIVDWLKGAFEAFDHKYLERLEFIFFIDGPTPTIQESYSFTFSYGDGHLTVNCENDRNDSTSLELKMNQIRASTVQLLRHTSIFIQSMVEMTENVCLRVKLYYFDDVTPEDYEPPGFERAADAEYVFERPTTRLRHGNVDTGFHKLALNSRIAKRMLKVPTEEGDAQDLSDSSTATESAASDHSPEAFNDCVPNSQYEFATSSQLSPHPKDSGPRSKGSGPRPKDNGPRPIDNGPLPKENGPRPRDSGARPKDNGPRPKDNGPLPKENGPRPRDSGARPKDNGPHPKDNGPLPKENGPHPKDSGARPKDNVPRPKDNGPRPKDSGRRCENNTRMGNGNESQKDKRTHQVTTSARSQSAILLLPLAGDAGRGRIQADRAAMVTSQPEEELQAREEVDVGKEVEAEGVDKEWETEKESEAEGDDVVAQTPTDVQNANVRCPCDVSADEGLLIFCDFCRHWNHAVCYRMLDESAVPSPFCCFFCHGSQPRAVCGDSTLLPLSEEQRRVICLYRRALVFSMSAWRVDPKILAGELSVSEELAEKLLAHMKVDRVFFNRKRTKGSYLHINSAVLKGEVIPKYFIEGIVVLPELDGVYPHCSNEEVVFVTTKQRKINHQSIKKIEMVPRC